MMKRIAILAYGSLIEDPGKEIKALVCERISGFQTPFSVEFARSSKSRDGAPTLVPVEDGGAPVRGAILVLDAGVEVYQAEDLLWRRETRNECCDRHYSPPTNPGPNTVVIEHLQDVAKVETVLYTTKRANIIDRTPEHLADLAICSARQDAGAKRMDGISYLISVKNQKIHTPLMSYYEAVILKKTNAQSLYGAYEKIRGGNA